MPTPKTTNKRCWFVVILCPHRTTFTLVICHNIKYKYVIYYNCMKGIFQVPTVLKIKLDASDFEKERNRVVDGVKELQAKTAQTNSVSVKVDPSDMSDLSDEKQPLPLL